MKLTKYLYFLFFGITCLLHSSLHAQKDTSRKVSDYDKGFDFYIGAGTYLGNKFTANYYNGISNQREVDIGRAIGNKYVKKQIDNLIRDRQRIILDAEGVRLREIDENMRYNMAFIFNFAALYHFNKSVAMYLSFSQARLTATGGITFDYNSGVPGNERPQILKYHLIGKELRNFFEIGVYYTFYTEGKVLPFVEFAAQLNSVRVKDADLFVEDHRFTLMDIYAGKPYVPNSGLTEIEPYLGGVGGGLVGGFGVRIPFTKSIALEPVVQVQYIYVNLEVNDRKRMMPNYNFMVRLIVGDQIFAK